MTMTMHFAGAEASPVAVPSRLEAFAASQEFGRPTLVLDVDVVEANYLALKAGLGHADIHYAVKANPARGIIERLVALGSHFDAASRGEIELCLGLGARPETISFGNTVKRPSDIAFAHRAGITLFAADAEEELEKIAEHAPGAEVYIRLIVETSEADWPLTRKFGCDREMAVRLMGRAVELGLAPVGFSFHVGSQTKRADMWAGVLDEMALIWADARAAGHELTLLNIGGGFPAFYGEAIDAPTDYAGRVMELVAERFGPVARVMAEPGRGLVAEAGVIACEVMLVIAQVRPGHAPLGLSRHREVLGARGDHGRGDPLPVRDAPRRRRDGALHHGGTVLRQRGRALREAAGDAAPVAEGRATGF
jgi:ornithine decarboxylase